MGHCLQAFIGPWETLENIRGRYRQSTICSLPQGLALLPFTQELFDAIPPDPKHPGAAFNGAGGETDHSRLLGREIQRFLLEYAGERGLLYFETEYFGGLGTQAAVAARSGRIVYGPCMDNHSINRSPESFRGCPVKGTGRIRQSRS